MPDENHLDGCGLDFRVAAIAPEDVEDLLIPPGEEEDEDDD